MHVNSAYTGKNVPFFFYLWCKRTVNRKSTAQVIKIRFYKSMMNTVHFLCYFFFVDRTEHHKNPFLQTAAAKRCRRHMIETDEFLSSNNDSLLTDPMTISAAYLKMKTLCINISCEIQADIKIHNQNILPR